MYVFLQFNSHQASYIIIYASLDFCNNTRPLKTHHISDVQYSCFLCCTKFLFSILYKIPVFNDVQYSCMRCCTLVCFALICRIKVWMYIILVGVLYLILMYTSIATLPSLCSAYQRFSRPCEPASALKKRTGDLLQKDSLWDWAVWISCVCHTLNSHNRLVLSAYFYKFMSA